MKRITFFTQNYISKKTTGVILSILSILGYGVFVFAATPPTGGFAPGAELDPTCTPGSVIDDCFVKQAWQQNVADGLVFNTTDKIGIGTDTPTVTLDVLGEVQINTTFTGGSVIHRQGDLAVFSGDHGIVNGVVNGDFSIFGISVLDFNSGNPLYYANLTSGTSSAYLGMSASGEFHLFLAPTPDISNSFNFDTDGSVSLISTPVAGMDTSLYFNTDGSVDLTTSSPTEGINFVSNIGLNDASDFRLHRGVVEMAAYNDSVADDEEGPYISLYTSVNSGGCTDDLATCHSLVGGNNGSGSILLFSNNLHGQSYNQWFNGTEDGLARLELNANGNAGAMQGSDNRGTYIDIWYDARPSGHVYKRNFGIGTCGGDEIPSFGCLDGISIGGNHNVKIGADVPAIGEYPRYALFPNINTLTELNTRPSPNIGNSEDEFDAFNGSGSAMVYSYASKNLFFYTDAGDGGTDAWEPVSPFERGTTETHLFNTSDLVGLGTIATTDKLEVAGDIRVGTSGVNGCLKDFSGGTITGTCSSDERLKTNISTVDNILDKFTSINLVTYDWNDIAQKKGFKGNTSQLGVLAQNVEQAFPELVITDTDGYKQVNYGRLNLLTIQAIKELNIKLDTIEHQSQIVVMGGGLGFEGVRNWLGNVGNGIVSVIADTIKARNEICIDDVCMTKDQLRSILENNGVTPASSPSPDPAPSPDPTPILDPVPDTSPDPVPVPESSPETTPEPEVISEPEPEIVPEPEPVIEEVPSESPVSEVI